MNTSFRILIVLALLPLLGACSSTGFYSSAIMGHEELAIPSRVSKDEGFELSGGPAVKIAPTWASFTRDFTQSLQAGYVLSPSIASEAGIGFQLGTALSGYCSLTGTDIGEEEYVEYDYNSSVGLTGQLHPVISINTGRMTHGVGISFLYNREWGEYGQFRENRENLDSCYEDLSPSGQSYSLSYTYYLENETSLGKFRSEAAIGSVIPDLYLDTVLPLWKFTELYQNDRIWFWAGLESMSFLNLSLNTGIGFFL